MIKKNHSFQKGFSVLLVILLLTFVFISLAGVTASVVMISKRQYATHLGARKAYYGAESYINRTLYKVIMGGDPPPDGHEEDLGGGNKVIWKIDGDRITVSQTGPKAKRTLEVTKGAEEGATTTASKTALMLILDCTGSMSDGVASGGSRMKAAKKAVDGFLKILRDDGRFDQDNSLVGLMSYEKNYLSYQNLDCPSELPYWPSSHRDFNLVPANYDNMKNLIDWINKFTNDPISQAVREHGYCRGFHTTGGTNTAGAVWKATLAQLADPEGFAPFNILVTDGEPTYVEVAAGTCDYKTSDDNKAIEAINCLADNVLVDYPVRHLVVLIADDSFGVGGSAQAKRQRDAIAAFKNLVRVGGYDESGFVFDPDALDLAAVLSELYEEIISQETFYLREIEPEAD